MKFLYLIKKHPTTFMAICILFLFNMFLLYKTPEIYNSERINCTHTTCLVQIIENECFIKFANYPDAKFDNINCDEIYTSEMQSEMQNESKNKPQSATQNKPQNETNLIIQCDKSPNYTPIIKCMKNEYSEPIRGFWGAFLSTMPVIFIMSLMYMSNEYHNLKSININGQVYWS